MTKELKRPLKQPKKAVKWNELFNLNDDGNLCIDGVYNGQWKEYIIADYLSENYRGPWPVQDSYAFIVDLSKGCALENLGWMMQNPEYRTVKS